MRLASSSFLVCLSVLNKYFAKLVSPFQLRSHFHLTIFLAIEFVRPEIHTLSNSRMSTTTTPLLVFLHKDAEILDLLTRLTASRHEKRTNISMPDATKYLLWTLPVDEDARLSVHEAVEELSRFIHSSSEAYISLNFSMGGSQLKGNYITFLLVACRFSKHMSHSLDVPDNLDVEHEDLEGIKPLLSAFQPPWMKLFGQQTYLPIHQIPKTDEKVRSGRRQPLRKSLFIMTIALLLALLIYMATTLFPHQQLWKRYIIGKSVGPEYQLSLTHLNVSAWKENSKYNSDDWALRIDDQSILPKALYNDNEDHYQHWFRNRYAEMEEIRQRQLYVNETFLSDPFSIQVPTDSLFHNAHCVLALRRYWWARESGRHVCPRDLDYKHIKHCLDTLDSLFFLGGTKGVVKQEPVSEDRFLHWKTKVCFDE
jgi:hypothetical protein